MAKKTVLIIHMLVFWTYLWIHTWIHQSVHSRLLICLLIVRNAAGRKSHLYGPLVKAFIGRSLSGRTPGTGEQGGKGSLRGRKGEDRLYSYGRLPI